MTEDRSDVEAKIHEELGEIDPDAEVAPDRAGRSFDDAEAEAAFWRAQFEQERERLAKLWVAYKDLDAELEQRKAKTEQIAEQKAAAKLDALEETREPSQAEPAARSEPQTEDAGVSPELAVPEGARDTAVQTETVPEREGDPFGDIHPVIEVEGIGEVYAKALDGAGITDTRRLWQADAKTVADMADVPEKRVRRWQAQAELMALDEVGPQYAELLVRSGITTIEDLREQDVESLLARVQAKQEELDVRIQGNPPTERRVARWIDAAENHDV